MMENQTFNVNDIEKFFDERRSYWMQVVSSMNERLLRMDDITSLQGEIFSRRQEAVENYHNLSAILAKKAKVYKENSAQKYKEIRLLKVSQGSNTYMFPTEGSVREQIEAQLSGDKYLIDIIENHINYLDNTIKTIDGIIYSISNRIKVEEIKIGK